MTGRAAFAFLLLSQSMAYAGPAAGGHTCSGTEATRYGYDAARDTVCRSEQEHLCRCRKETIVAAPGVIPPATYYDASRDRCLDSLAHFQCLEKGGEYICRSQGRCLCDTKPPICKEADLTDWKAYACGQGNCEDTRLLQGREPKPDVNCKGGGRWKCVTSATCPKKGKNVCKDKDFAPWRSVGCAVGGCPRGQMRGLRDKKTHLLCDTSLYERCLPDPSCPK